MTIVVSDFEFPALVVVRLGGCQKFDVAAASLMVKALLDLKKRKLDRDSSDNQPKSVRLADTVEL